MAEVEFRDGKRQLPEHVAVLMKPLPTYKLTYEEAVKQMNSRLETELLSGVQGRVISNHFRNGVG